VIRFRIYFLIKLTVNITIRHIIQVLCNFDNKNFETCRNSSRILDNFVEFLVDFWTKLSNFDNCRNSYEIATEGEGEREGGWVRLCKLNQNFILNDPHPHPHPHPHPQPHPRSVVIP
jgi:hypothetical protein